ncbi:MAG: LacI family DNA-binding transcriptional regulator [Prolixibacteraceae bacterium]|jgi:LacI family transcriptional regulator|nr:LacI family DNA-binding transcriptional regulator [Prolixibacteraceae bacterium]
MSERITIKDIAKELGIHHSTVSRALRGDVRVKEETRKKVKEYAYKQGYQVNMNALQLRGSINNVIAIIVPNINHDFFSNIVSYITNLSVQNGFIVSVFQSNESYSQEENIINTIIQNNVAGVIASVTMETGNSDHFKKLDQFNIPLVLFDRFCDDIQVPKVIVNNEGIVFDAVKKLFDKGCRRIAHIGGPQSVNVFKDRQTGYMKALDSFELNFQQSFFIDKDFTIENGKLTMLKLINLFKRPDGVIVDSNILLLGVLLELKKFHLKIPEDIAVIGFSNDPLVEAFCPGVISIVQPDTEIAQNAFDLLMKQLNGFDRILIKDIIVSAKIIE